MKKSILLGVAVLSLAVSSSASPLPKLVVVHTMGMMPAGNGWAVNGLFPQNDFARTRPYFAVMYGGNTRMLPLASFFNYTRSDGTYNFNRARNPRSEATAGAKYQQEPYRWDLEMAEEQGIDALGLLLSGNEPSYKHAVGWFRRLEAMLRENPRLKIRLTLTFPGNDLAERAKNPKKFAWVERFMAEFRNSPAWLRHDGRIVLHGYKSHVSWSTDEALRPEFIKKTMEMHKQFFRDFGFDNPIFLYDGPEYAPGQITPSRKPGTPADLAAIAGLVCGDFEVYGCWGGVIPNEIYPGNYRAIAAEVNRRGRGWMMPILDIHSGVGQFYMSKPGVERLVDTWNLAMETNARVAQPVTWNDTAEATGFQPSNSFNYALADLNGKFIHRFKAGKFPETGRDEVFLFYRKYHPSADPELYPRVTVERDRDKWGETDDMLHAFVFAKAPGEVRFSGTSNGVETRPLQAGYNEFKLKTAVGREIAARVFRNGKLEHELVSPERVTARPYREDLIPWGWSSGCRAKYDRDFGPDFRPLSEYSERWNDGIPDWFRLHWFGTTEKIPGSGAHDDPDGDGADNSREYELGENPRSPNPVYAPGFRWNDFGKAFAKVTDPKQFARERVNLNPFPDANGKLVHGFLYASGGQPYNGVYPWLMKWANGVYNQPPNWGFRTGRRHNFRLGPNGGIEMTLLPDYAGIYRFWTPVAGKFTVRATLRGDAKSPVTFRIQDGPRELRKLECAPGATVIAELSGEMLPRRAKLDFIVSSRSAVKVELSPEIVFQGVPGTGRL